MNKLEQAARQVVANGVQGTYAKYYSVPPADFEALREALEQPAKTLISKEAFDWIDANAPMFVREALDHSANAGNKVSDHIADAGKVIPQFIPVGIVNDHHSITWMEEIVDDQAPIGAILYALQDSVGRNVSFADESVCNWRQPTYDHSDANYWDTDCGKSWAITEGTPTENGMKFCHGCGKPIKEHPFVDSEDEQ